MWRTVWSCGSLRQSISAAVGGGFGRTKPLTRPFALGGGFEFCNNHSNDDNYCNCTSRAPLFFSNTFFFSSSSSSGDGDGNGDGVSSSNSKNKFDSKPSCVKEISLEEAKKLMRLVNVEELKRKLGMDGKEVIPYSELIDACESIGVARSPDEATAFARVLDEAGVVLLFRDKVYLHPDKVVDLVRRAVPLALTADDDPIRDELKMLLKKKEEIDVLAHKQVRRILYSGLVVSVLQISLFFRLTFWEFSWDVMEPIAFFATTAGIVIGYAYFLFTARDPTYQDLMKRLFLSRQRKLIKKQNFDINRFKELQMKCKIPTDACASIKNRLGLELELEDAIHRD